MMQQQHGWPERAAAAHPHLSEYCRGTSIAGNAVSRTMRCCARAALAHDIHRVALAGAHEWAVRDRRAGPCRHRPSQAWDRVTCRVMYALQSDRAAARSQRRKARQAGRRATQCTSAWSPRRPHWVVSGRARQERLGMQLTLLLEDPEGATLSRLAADAAAAAAAGGSAAAPPCARSAWIAPAPSTVWLRLFCLPYAGGVSENVFARCAALTACARAQPRISCCSCHHAAVAAPEPACHHLAEYGHPRAARLLSMPVNADIPSCSRLADLQHQKHILPEVPPQRSAWAPGGPCCCRPATRSARWRSPAAGGARASPRPPTRPRSRACSRAPCLCRRARAVPARIIQT